MVNWPAFIKYDNDDELLYITGQAAWDADNTLSHFDYTAEDRLVDCSGRVFSLSDRQADKVVLQQTEQCLSLEQVLGLIKAHASERGSCCVAKLFAPSIEEAFKMLESLAQ